MNVSLNWLKDYLELPESAKEIAAQIGLKSTEVAFVRSMSTATNLTVGWVKECIRHPQADKLSVCQVEVKEATLQIVCGAPNVKANQKVIVALPGAVLPGNISIQKTTIRGVESNGMICSLDELGIEHKFHGEDGIHELLPNTLVGANPLEVLAFNDTIIGLDLTPNKGYLLSYLGVAYDISAIYNRSVKEPSISLHEIEENNPVSIAIHSEDCKSYYSRVVKNITIQESPSWLKARLIANDIRPINNVVDITNYVMLEYGQPLHAFDYNKLQSTKILVRKAFQGERFTTLDGNERLLVEDDLVITNGEKAVALAGVMGGLETAVDSQTQSVLLESAVFHPLAVRKTSRRLDLRSESSMRFEKGLDPNRTVQALNRAAMLLEELANGQTLSGISYQSNIPPYNHTISLTLQKINAVLGSNMTFLEVLDIIRRYGYLVQTENDSLINVHIPSRRRDLITDQDLIEEIVRLYGFDRIPTTLPITRSVGKRTEKQRKAKTIKEALTSLGFDEVITYSLVSQQKAVMFDLQEKKSITLLHPMTEERSTLRHSLLPSLLEVASYNLARKNEGIHVFELGRVYEESGEKERLSGLLDGQYLALDWQKKNTPVDFYHVKGIVEAILALSAISDYEIVPVDKNVHFLHPGIAASVYVNGKSLGHFGRLHPETERQLGLSKMFVFELDYDQMTSIHKPLIRMKEIAKVPKVSRDLAIIVKEEVTAKNILDVIRQVAKDVLQSVDIFDVYRGEAIGEGNKSIAISLVLQDANKTLETAQVDEIMKSIIQALERHVQGSLRS